MSGPERVECARVGVCVTLSASSECSAALVHVCMSVYESSYSEIIMLHTHTHVSVDSVTHWVSHTFQNKRLPLRITIDPCRALSCIWKERRLEREREYTTSSLSLCLLARLLRNVMCLSVCGKSVRDDLETVH